MKINKNDYTLSGKNYISEGTIKTRIVLGNTFSSDMQHTIGWSKRNGGEYKKTAMFTVSLNGEIHQHFPPKYFSNFTNDIKLDESIISILIENEGWLNKNLLNEKEYVNYVGTIYKRDDSIFNKKWRNFRYWAPYSEEQFNSAINLVKELSKTFDIPLNVIDNNTIIKNESNDNGVFYKSNFNKGYTDLSPAWDFKLFKNKVEEI
tara:strand:+ start:5011 stop:5625 length:615 start_codon:yes stop_codon:yes gene_type:complete